MCDSVSETTTCVRTPQHARHEVTVTANGGILGIVAVCSNSRVGSRRSGSKGETLGGQRGVIVIRCRFSAATTAVAFAFTFEHESFLQKSRFLRERDKKHRRD